MRSPPPLYFRDVELLAGRRADVRVADGRIVAIGQLAPQAGDAIVEAHGGLLIPGLHDHHLHLAATAAAGASVRCGPPDIVDSASLAAALSGGGSGWLRGVGYHESVAGMLDRAWLDRVTGDRPARIQHRGGRMWFLNSAGLDMLLATGLVPPSGLDRTTGRLFDEDAWLRRALGSSPPGFAALGAHMAALGITGVTDMGPANGALEWTHIASQQASGALPQRVMLAGRPELADREWSEALLLGPYVPSIAEPVVTQG